MSYSDFTLQEVARSLGVTTAEADLFPGASPAKVPSWLPATIARGTRLAFVSEKARSEFIVAPILLAARELSGDQIAIFSGERLDVDSGRGLVGETDFILAVCPPVMPLRAPIAVIVEAKKNDIEGGLGQCIAQMFAARLFNEADYLLEGQAFALTIAVVAVVFMLFQFPTPGRVREWLERHLELVAELRRSAGPLDPL